MPCPAFYSTHRSETDIWIHLNSINVFHEKTNTTATLCNHWACGRFHSKTLSKTGTCVTNMCLCFVLYRTYVLLSSCISNKFSNSFRDARLPRGYGPIRYASRHAVYRRSRFCMAACTNQFKVQFVLRIDSNKFSIVHNGGFW